MSYNWEQMNLKLLIIRLKLHYDSCLRKNVAICENKIKFLVLHF